MSATCVGTVATVWRYPVKSMLGEELNASQVTTRGLLGDRAHALVDHETGKVVSAKNPNKWPELFAYRAAYTTPPTEGALPPTSITLPDGRVLRSDDADIDDQLSKSLARSVTLKQAAPEKAFLEQYWPEHAGSSNEITAEAMAGDAPPGSFFDYATVHIVSTATLDSLRACYPEGRFEVRRFRPNIVVDTAGLRGFVENDWIGKILTLGESVRLHISDPCPRCVMTTLAQGDLPKDPGIFRNAIVRNSVHVPFAGRSLPSVGVYARVISIGSICRGDAVAVHT